MEAWRKFEHAAREFIERGGEVTPASLAEHLRIPEEAAASLMKILRTDDEIRRYRSRFPPDGGDSPLRE